MTDPLQDPPAVKPRTSLVTDGAMRPGAGSVILFALASFCLSVATTWVVIAVVNKTHSNFDDVLIGGCLLAAVLLVAPADFAKAVDVLKPVLPSWGKREERGGGA